VPSPFATHFLLIGQAVHLAFAPEAKGIVFLLAVPLREIVVDRLTNESRARPLVVSAHRDDEREGQADRVVRRVIVNSAQDRPWSQYFCCMLAGNREFVRKNPIATKRVVRAMLRATDLCVSEPALVAQRMVDRGFTPRHDYAVQTLADVPYNRWRHYDPEDTIRFYALRLREARMLKSNPAKIIADAADWRFLNEVRRELGS
jgi:hypothetical protein